MIHTDQSGFIKGRFIGQTVRLVDDILLQTELLKMPRIMCLDFQKAFDTVERSFIQKALSFLWFQVRPTLPSSSVSK